MASSLHVHPIKKIDAEIAVPGDKSISHRALILASIAEGPTQLRGFLAGEDCRCTLQALQALGAGIEQIDETTINIVGRGAGLVAACEPLDCGNSGTAMRLLAGLLSAQNFRSRLFGDKSLSSRPMRRVLEPLRKMGARIQALGPDDRPPLEIQGGELEGIHYTLPVASAQVKSAVLLAGLFAKGTTTVTSPTASRDHTERLLKHFFAPVQMEANRVSLRGGTVLHGNDLNIPGDFSSAAFWLVAAAAMPQARLTVSNVGLNPTRTALVNVLLRMGAQIQESIQPDYEEPYGTLSVMGRQLRATQVGGAEVANLIDEIPILAVAAALAEGETVIRDARELRVKETDRIHAMAQNLSAFGVPVEEREDGLAIQGRAPLHGARVSSFGDHRIAMACAILGLFAKGGTVVEDTACIATSYPGFEEELRRISGQTVGFGMLRRWMPAWA